MTNIFLPLFFQTQPVPNPVAYYMHRSPWWFHRFETLFNHFIELVVPFFIFLGRRMCMVHGVLQILFQVRLVHAGVCMGENTICVFHWLHVVTYGIS